MISLFTLVSSVHLVLGNGFPFTPRPSLLCTNIDQILRKPFNPLLGLPLIRSVKEYGILGVILTSCICSQCCIALQNWHSGCRAQNSSAEMEQGRTCLSNAFREMAQNYQRRVTPGWSYRRQSIRQWVSSEVFSI